MFEDRHDAGQQLSARLEHYREHHEAIVLSVPRGGIIVAFEVARELGLPLDVLLVRRLAASTEEVKFGDTDALERAIRLEEADTRRRARKYRGDAATPLSLAGKVALIVDDGIASGKSMRAATEAVRDSGVSRLVIASPLAPKHLLPRLRELADEVVVLATPEPFWSVDAWYEDFAPVSDDEVGELVRRQLERGQAPNDRRDHPRPQRES